MSPKLMSSALQRGFTLVELMVAMAIGLILTIVLMTVFLDTRKGYSVQDDQARLQENTRFAVQTISRIVRQASYRSFVGISSSSQFPSGTTPAITGIDGSVAAGSATSPATDQITVRFQGSGNGTGTADNTIFDCLGNSYDFGVSGMSTFAIRSGGADGNGLFCTKDDPLSANPVWQEIVPGVENMQILYGLDSDADRAANVYEQINNISSTTANLDQIVSVRFSLLLRGPTETAPVVNTNTYSLNGVTTTAVNDRRVRRVVNFTVNLRNRTP